MRSNEKLSDITYAQSPSVPGTRENTRLGCLQCVWKYHIQEVPSGIATQEPLDSEAQGEVINTWAYQP